MTIRRHLPKELDDYSIEEIIWSLIVTNGYDEVNNILSMLREELLNERIDKFIKENYGRTAA